MSSVIRCFIAIDLDIGLRKKIFEVSENLGAQMERSAVRWVDPSKMHLTLKFLGDVSESIIPRIEEIMLVECHTHKEFEMSFGGLGAFPNMNQPRVIWVGVEAPDELFVVQRRIESEMDKLGYTPDKKEFNPHLTLGRVGRNANKDQIKQISEGLRKFKLGFVGATRVTAVHLYKSDLRPGGAVYSKMYSAPLAGS